VDATSGRVEGRLSQEAVHVAFAPRGKLLAFLAPTRKPAIGLDIVLWNLDTSTSRVLVQNRVGGRFGLSWHPSGETLAFDGTDGWIESVGLDDGQTTRLVEGTTPA